MGLLPELGALCRSGGGAGRSGQYPGRRLRIRSGVRPTRGQRCRHPRCGRPDGRQRQTGPVRTARISLTRGKGSSLPTGTARQAGRTAAVRLPIPLRFAGGRRWLPARLRKWTADGTWEKVFTGVRPYGYAVGTEPGSVRPRAEFPTWTAAPPNPDPATPDSFLTPVDSVFTHSHLGPAPDIDIGSWTLTSTAWWAVRCGGVVQLPLSTVLDLTRPRPSARHVWFQGASTGPYAVEGGQRTSSTFSCGRPTTRSYCER